MNKKQLQVIQDYENRNPEKFTIFTDPATIGMIVSAAKFAYETWGKKKSDNNKWLKEIANQLTEIKRLLIGVTKALDLLRVHIDYKFEELLTTSLIATIQTIEANNSHWRRNNDRYLNNNQTQKEIQELLFDLQKGVRQLMQYGYGHYDTIAFAMRIELYLTMISNRNIDSLNKLLETYRQHFNECLNISMKNSIAFALDTVEKEIIQMRNETNEGRFLVKEYEEVRRNDIYRISHFQNIKGNLDLGFTMTPEVTKEYIGSVSQDCTSWTCLIKNYKESESQLNTLFKSGDRFAIYQQVYKIYMEVHKPNKQALAKSTEMITNYIKQINNYLAE
jgi:hypothetical protein